MRTLIVSCSGTKKNDAGLLPALDRYDGPAYRTLRANLEAAGELRIIILSAEFGLLEPDATIPDYDRRMNAARAAVLAPRVGAELLRMAQLGELDGEIFVFGGDAYRACLRLGLHDTPLLERIRFSHGGIGEQLGQLKAFLLQPSIDAELKASAEAYPPTSLDDELLAAGFTIEETAGGCRAFVRRKGETSDVVTTTDGCDLPSADDWLLCTYAGDWQAGSDVEMIDNLDCESSPLGLTAAIKL